MEKSQKPMDSILLGKAGKAKNEYFRKTSIGVYRAMTGSFVPPQNQELTEPVFHKNFLSS